MEMHLKKKVEIIVEAVQMKRMLEMIEASGGKVLIPKRQINPERGYMAFLEDTEGNRIALQSEN